MTKVVNRWTAQVAWVVLMIAVGRIFVPDAISMSSFFMFAVTGCAVIVAASALWSAHQPAQSASQARVVADAADAAAGRRK
jgi:hypothetical protein